MGKYLAIALAAITLACVYWLIVEVKDEYPIRDKKKKIIYDNRK